MIGEFMAMKWPGRVAAILAGGVLFSWATLASGQIPNDADCVVSQNGVCLDAVIQNTPPDAPAPKPAPVTFKKGRLTIMAEGTSLRDILSAVSSQTGVDIVLPPQGLEEKVVVHLGPGPMRDVLVELLNGSSFNYVMLASPADPTVLQHLMLTSRTTMPGAVIAANPLPAEPAAAAGPALYGQGFSTDASESDNSEAEASRMSNSEWASKQGQLIDQMQKQRIKQREQEEQQQQQQQQQPAAPQPE